MNKVLIGTPYHKCKKYIYEEFVKNIEGIQNNSRILIKDNSKGNKDSRINMLESLKYLAFKFLEGNYTHFFLVEADLLPKQEIINELIKHDKDVVSAVYPICKRKSIFNITQNFYLANNKTFSNLFVNPGFLDGTLKKVPLGAGLGCILIKRKVLESIRFRSGQWHPDIYFWQDLKAYGFQGYIDTSIIVKHYPNGASSIEKEVK